MNFTVLHVVGGSKFGGIGPHIASLVRMARQHGGEGAVLTSDDEMIRYFVQRSIEVVNIPGIDREINPVQDFRGLIRLIRYLRHARYTIVHTHTSKGGFIGRLAARIAKVPVVIHNSQGFAFHDYATGRLQQSCFRQLERLGSRWCDVVVVANRYDEQCAIEAGVATGSKVRWIPNGINLDEIDKAVPSAGTYASLGVSPDHRVIGVIARLFPQKGVEYFVRALPEIRRRFPLAQPVIVGDGPLLSALEEEARSLGVLSALKFCGFRRDWIEVMKVIDVLVMPSLWEGLPITLLGAMAAGRAIVATRIKGVIDVCPDQIARLIPPRDSASLADGVCAFLQDPDAATRCGSAARAWVEERYAESRVTEKFWELYASLMSRAQSGRQAERAREMGHETL